MITILRETSRKLFGGRYDSTSLDNWARRDYDSGNTEDLFRLERNNSASPPYFQLWDNTSWPFKVKLGRAPVIAKFHSPSWQKAEQLMLEIISGERMDLVSSYWAQDVREWSENHEFRLERGR